MLFVPCGCTHPPPPVPPFMLMQNLSPKDIARIGIFKLKVSLHHIKSLGWKGLINASPEEPLFIERIEFSGSHLSIILHSTPCKVMSGVSERPLWNGVCDIAVLWLPRWWQLLEHEFNYYSSVTACTVFHLEICIILGNEIWYTLASQELQNGFRAWARFYPRGQILPPQLVLALVKQIAFGFTSCNLKPY